MGLRLYIPLAAHLVAYMHHDSHNDGDAYKVSSKSDFGMMVLNWLQDMPNGVAPGPPKEGSYLEIKINERYTEGRGRWLSPDKCKLLASWIRRNYEREMCFFVRDKRAKHGMNRDKAIEAWRRLNGITEEMRQLESDLREYTRKKLA